MKIRQSFRSLCIAAIATVLVAAAGPVAAQVKSTPAALLLAKELIEVKGATKAFDPIIGGVIDYHRKVILQSNPNLSKDLDEISNHLMSQMAPRRLEIQQQVVRAYASRFTEKELRDALAFYRTPLGQKLVKEEPQVLEDSMKVLDEWSKKFAEEVFAKMRDELKKRGRNPI
jgi:hypothetical protein